MRDTIKILLGLIAFIVEHAPQLQDDFESIHGMIHDLFYGSQPTQSQQMAAERVMELKASHDAGGTASD